MTTSKDAIVAASAKIEEHTIEGIAGPVLIKCARYNQVKRWMTADSGDIEAIMCSVVDETGAELLTREDVEALPLNVFKALVNAVLAANGLGGGPGKN